MTKSKKTFDIFA